MRRSFRQIGILGTYLAFQNSFFPGMKTVEKSILLTKQGTLIVYPKIPIKKKITKKMEKCSWIKSNFFEIYIMCSSFIKIERENKF